MLADEFLEKLGKLHLGDSAGSKALHKPLMLLVVLSRAEHGRPTRMTYMEADEELTPLLTEYAHSANFRLPFWRLRNDGVWEVQGAETLHETSSGDVLTSELTEANTGDFPEPIPRLVRRDPSFRHQAIEIVASHLPPGIRAEVLQRLGLRTGPVGTQPTGALATWWNDDPKQRYWMQITDRDDLDGPLLSPRLPQLKWGYDLVSQVQPGDRVLHWQARAPRGLVGWSEVDEPATVVPEYTHAPRSGGEERTTPGWCAALGPFHAFTPPVTAAELLPLLGKIEAVKEELKAQGKDKYFPITRYGKDRPVARQEVRATEAYFAKFPVELFDAIPRIGSALIDAPLDPAETDLPEDLQPPGKKAPAGRTTRAQDPKLRTAIERQSLDLAKAYYVGELGGTNYKEVGKPYDIRVVVGGVTRRCEVKGSSMEIDTVELTINEVEHGTAFTPIDLIVVDKIVPIRDPDTGEVIGATGGRRRIWIDWTPSQSDLRAQKYAYTLPPGPIF